VCGCVCVCERLCGRLCCVVCECVCVCVISLKQQGISDKINNAQQTYISTCDFS
jgi:hypothetical protein